MKDTSKGELNQIGLEKALIKIRGYCAYQERSHQEVKNKLYTYGLPTDDVNEIIARLITDGFLNESRFAKAFAGGKFRIKRWGRLKIMHELKFLGITPKCIAIGMKEINADDYAKILDEIMEKKWETVSTSNSVKKRFKVAHYAISRGFESELVWEHLKRLYP